jgi:hypothetical protein
MCFLTTIYFKITVLWDEVWLVGTNVWEQRSTYIFRVDYSLKMEVERFSKMFVSAYQTAWHATPETITLIVTAVANRNLAQK